MATNWVKALTDYVDTLEAAIGAIEGATALHNKLTAARAALLDQITAARQAELDAANIPADVDTLLARLTALRATNLDTLDTAETAATYSHPNDVTEDTVFTSAFGGLRTKVLAVWLDMVNHTQVQTIRFKHTIDGVNYRTFATVTWNPTDDPGVLLVPVAVNSDIRVTVQSAVLEGVARNLPYYYISQVVE